MEYLSDNPLLLIGLVLATLIGLFIYFVSKEMDNLPWYGIYHIMAKSRKSQLKPKSRKSVLKAAKSKKSVLKAAKRMDNNSVILKKLETELHDSKK